MELSIAKESTLHQMAVSTGKNRQNAKKKINNIYKQTNIKGSSINNYWTEKEDDILTRSIQKYGINKWNKIATLLMRKSAIQCKLRWEEYLSPKINNNSKFQKEAYMSTQDKFKE